MGKKVVNDSNLTSIADAIRSKTGNTAGLVFPGGFTDAIGTLVYPDDYLAKVCNGELTEVVNDKITKIPPRFQRNNKNLTKVSLPYVNEIPEYAVSDCSMLTSMSFSGATIIGSQACGSCSRLTSVYLPELTTMNGWGYTFAECSGLEKVYLPKFTGTLQSRTFNSNIKLVTLILGASTMCSLGSTGAFNNTPIASGTGYIYVPKALLDSYKAATNWSTYSNQFRAIEDYPAVLEGWA